METVVLLAVLIGAVSADSHRDRRILLHSDTDVAQAIHALQTDNVQMQKDLINIQSQNAQLQNNVSNLQINISQLHSHNSQLQGTVTQQQIENSQLRGNVSQLQGTVSRLQSQDSQLQGNVSQLQGTVSRLQSQDSQLQGNVSQLQGTVSRQQSQNSQLQTTVNHMQSANRGTGSSYVRWGRTVCPTNGTTLTYSGYMGGGKYTHTGAAVNHLCLTADPIWDHYDEHVASGGKVYGVEYNVGEYHAAGAAEFFGRNMYDQDAPCAVCHSPRSAAMMIPGRNQCYPGWTQEYSGYLMSGGENGYTAATEYICLDRRPEAIPGGGTSDNENLLYLVEGVCGGSLECPPYIDGRELTCVVCTK